MPGRDVPHRPMDFSVIESEVKHHREVQSARIHWLWAVHAEHQNVDLLPELLVPEGGCPITVEGVLPVVCDAVFTKIHAFGVVQWQWADYLAEDEHHGLLVGSGDVVPVAAVKLVCSEGHITEHRPRVSWHAAVFPGLGALAYLFARSGMKGSS